MSNRKSPASIGTPTSDSGVGGSFRSLSSSSSNSDTELSISASTKNNSQNILFHDFITNLFLKNIPYDFVPISGSTSLIFPEVIQVEKWLLGKLATPNLQPEIDTFFANLKLFSVRSAPKELIQALHNLGLLHPGEQFPNGFTAFQTSIMWKNSDAIEIFGCREPETAFQQLFENSDDFAQQSPLDFAALRHPEMLLNFLEEVTFDFTTLAVLLRATLPPKCLDEFFMKSVETGVNLFVDILLCVFGANIAFKEPETGRNCLHVAAAKGHVSMMELLLRKNANPNAETAENELPEDLAPRNLRKKILGILNPFRKRRFDKIREILLKGQSLDLEIVPMDFATVDEAGNNILAIAVCSGGVGNLRTLLRVSGCPMNAQNCQTGRCVLADAVMAGRGPEVVRILLESEVKPSVRDCGDLSALDIAVELNDVVVVKMMMEYRECWTGLHATMRRAKSKEMTEVLKDAFGRRQEEMVKPALVLATTENVDAAEILGDLEPGDLLNFLNDLDETPSFLAAKNGRTSSLQIIVDLGGDFWSRHRRTLASTIHIAAAGGHADTIKYLIECFINQHRPLNLNSLDNDGKTALHCAAEKGHTEAVRTLLELGASPNGYFIDGVLLTSGFEATQAVLDEYRLERQMILFRSIEKGSLKGLKSAWESHLDHYLRNHIGDTPIMVAAQFDHTAILDFLLSTAEQDYRPYSLDLNIPHDANVDAILRRKEIRPDHVSPYPTNTSPHQWIFGRGSPDHPETVPTLFLDQHRVNHASATNLNDGCCAVHRAIEVSDNVDMIKRLITRDPYCVNIPEHNGFTPLHLALILRRARIIRFLIKQPEIDLYATDLLGRIPEELADTPKTQELIRTVRTQPSAVWAALCDELIPVSTADGLSNWTTQFKSVQWSEAGESPLGSVSVFAGKTSASQDGVYEFIDRERENLKEKSTSVEKKLKILEDYHLKLRSLE